MMVDRSIFNCEYIHYTLRTILSVNNVNDPFYTNIPVEETILSSKDSYLQIELDVLREDNR